MKSIMKKGHIERELLRSDMEGRMTKQELKSYINQKREIVQLQEQIEQIKQQIYLVSSTRITGAPGGSGSLDKIADNIARLDELMRYYVEKLQQTVERQKRIEKEIENLPEQERVLMRYRYIEGLEWTAVAVKMNYSWKQTHRIHGNALQKLSEEIKDDTQ